MTKHLEYQTLDNRAIVKQLEALRNRVSERFPTRGLTQTVTHLCNMARPAAREASSLGDRIWWLRLLSALALAAGACGFYRLFSSYKPMIGDNLAFAEFTQALDASLNIVLMSGLFILFFLRLESRFKRAKALNGLYRLRAIAHVIDMHQLTKDPPSILGRQRTSSSPLRDLTEEQMLRYLDYCTEMLSLTAKLAALYAQYFRDEGVLSAVNDIEELTTNLSRQIWQKIMLVHSSQQPGAGSR